MAELFQIKDYIKINSTDFVNEFREKYIHFESPARDVRYWINKRGTADGERFRKFLSGEVLLVDNNLLTVELPKELVGNTEVIEQMVDAVFGHEGTDRGVLPTPEQLLHYFHLKVKVLYGSARWEVSGRCVHIHFSTQVFMNGKASRLTPGELESGIKCYRVMDNTVFRSVQEVVLNPDGVEYLETTQDNYLIKKSQDESIIRRKFYLCNRHLFDSSENDLLNLARNFAPHRVSEQLGELISHRDFVYSTGPYHFEKNFFSFKFRRSHCCYLIEARNRYTDVGETLKYYDKLKSSFEKSLEVIAGKRKNAPQNPATKNLKHESITETIEIQEGFFRLLLDYNELRHPAIYDMEEEIRNRIEVCQLISDFLRQDVGVDESCKENLSTILADYAYRKIILDPITYSDEDMGELKKFARSLMV